jgi:hypothetical protein
VPIHPRQPRQKAAIHLRIHQSSFADGSDKSFNVSMSYGLRSAPHAYPITPIKTNEIRILNEIKRWTMYVNFGILAIVFILGDGIPKKGTAQ